MNNEIDPNAEYTIMLRKDKGVPEHIYWSNYIYEGRILKMNSPKKGQLVRLPFGELCKIVNIGTEAITNHPPKRDYQFPAVYLVRVPG